MTTHALTEAAPTVEPGHSARRVLLKLSGEVFGGGKVGVDPDVVQALWRQQGGGNVAGAAGRARGCDTAALA